MKQDVENASTWRIMHISGLGLGVSLALGGLGLFLISVKLLSNGLKSVSGEKLRNVLKKFTKTNIHSLLFGVIFTTMIQSSDGAVALIISLVAAGFMPLRSALAFVLGANIGTATTSIIVSLSSNFEFTQYFMILAIIGGMGYLLIKDKSKSNIAMIIASMGMLFIGLKVMGAGMKTISAQETFKTMVSSVGTNGWYSSLTSFGMTGLMQSSSASVTVAQNIYAHSHSMSIIGGVGFVIGANVGTTVTAFLTTAGGNKDTKRIAVFWMITNTSMAILVLSIIGPYTWLVQEMVHQHINPKNPEGFNNFELSIGHVLFNIFLVVVFFPLLKYMEKIVQFIVREDKEVEFEYNSHLPLELIQSSPQMALEAANNVFYTIGEMNLDSFRSIEKFTKTKERKYLSRTEKLSVAVSESRRSLYDYLARLNTMSLTELESSRAMKLVLATRSQERISELLFSLEEILKSVYDKKRMWFNLSPSAFTEVTTALMFVKKVQKRTLNQSMSFTKKSYGEIKLVYNELLEFTQSSIENHEKRVKELMCVAPDIDYHQLMHIFDRIASQQYKMAKYFSPIKPKKKIAKPSRSKRLQAIYDAEE